MLTQTRWVRWLVPWLVCVILLQAGCPGWHSATQAQKVNPDARIVKEFNDRVQEYVKLHKRVEAGLPPLSKKTDAESMAAHQQALVGALRAARPNAKPGDIFTPAVQRYLLRILSGQLKGPGTASARAAIKESSPKNLPLRVNEPYPEAAPLPMVPPALLLNLPKLPEEMDYRFVDRHLILRDTRANLIIDFIAEVIP
jgi:hypothetical protein